MSFFSKRIDVSCAGTTAQPARIGNGAACDSEAASASVAEAAATRNLGMRMHPPGDCFPGARHAKVFAPIIPVWLSHCQPGPVLSGGDRESARSDGTQQSTRQAHG